MRTIEIELNRYVEDPADYVSDPAELEYEPDEYVTWSAEWWLKGSSQSTTDSDGELQKLVDTITTGLERWGDHYVFQLDWSLRGDPPDCLTLEQAVEETGVVLPTRLPAK
ncbi:hypothetical protein ACIBG5_10905 [Kribbella sp. NPDC050241]|uniref:hypothetical protein n=1 Tax=Kribbella sp. NPDC050241 TaxID=3364115 RepID=UPI0037B81C39